MLHGKKIPCIPPIIRDNKYITKFSKKGVKI